MILLEKHAEEERRSHAQVDDRAIVEADEFETAVEEGRAPLRLREVVGPTIRERAENDRLHLPCTYWYVARRGANLGHPPMQDELGGQVPDL